MAKRSCSTIILTALWALCSLHCVVDKAFAHWHRQASGQVHHHHHPLGEAHDHDHDGSSEPVGGHSHDSGSTPCCGFKVTLANRILLVLCSDSAFGHISQASAFIRILLFLPVVKESAYLRRDLFQPPFTADLYRQLKTLSVPNAPPSPAAI